MTISQKLTVRNAPRPSFCLTLMLAFQRMMIGMERTGDVRNKDRHERNWDSILITSVQISKTTIKIVRPTVRGTLVGVHLAI